MAFSQSKFIRQVSGPLLTLPFEKPTAGIALSKTNAPSMVAIATLKRA